MKEKKLNEHESRVLNAIPIGRENRRLIADIAATLGISKRDLYDTINGLILKHKIAIVSSRDGLKGGVYIPLDEEEKQVGFDFIED